MDDLSNYTVTVNGVEIDVQLSDEDAQRLGSLAKPAKVKAAPTPENKEAPAPENK